ncbi:Hydantoinaseoxoprolinase, N-terminal [Cinara cedri]|uniref:Hydantoinaseoxoprolinase, N-terminal n=1 Tax=Cinara cedri TaxID=506608 RepID=A0A5E4M587_9HEMI|nr:Hydantoinaseoxoprolinase, N-terminal [Cinara cedri]
MSRKLKFALDQGGTFTDTYARCPNGEVRVMKLLSVDLTNYLDAPREGIRTGNWKKYATERIYSTRGFKDLLHIGNKAHPKIFDFKIMILDVCEEVFEVDCHIINFKCEKCATCEDIQILKQIDEAALKSDLVLLKAKGFNSIAVALMHYYTYVEHEFTVG